MRQERPPVGPVVVNRLEFHHELTISAARSRHYILSICTASQPNVSLKPLVAKYAVESLSDNPDPDEEHDEMRILKRRYEFLEQGTGRTQDNKNPETNEPEKHKLFVELVQNLAVKQLNKLMILTLYWHLTSLTTEPATRFSIISSPYSIKTMNARSTTKHSTTYVDAHYFSI